MKRRIKDWNRNEIVKNEVFHFKNSLRPFVNVDNTSGDFCFLDLNEMKVYTLGELEYEELYFYTIEEDDDFRGVEVIGDIKEWFKTAEPLTAKGSRLSRPRSKKNFKKHLTNNQIFAIL